MTTPFFLALDSSVKSMSVALFEQQRCLASIKINQEKTAATWLTPAIDHLMTTIQLSYAQLAAVAVCGGPGSYTGLRIATATAKGLAYAYGIPLISLSSLELLCRQIQPVADKKWRIRPMIDARRMEVFTALFNSEGEKLEAAQATVLTEEFIQAENLQGPVLYIGDGSSKVRTLLSQDQHYQVVDQIYNPDVAFAGDLIFYRYEKQLFEDLVLYEPEYLKEYMFKTKTPQF